MYLCDLGVFFGSFSKKKSVDFGVPEALEDASGAMLASMGAHEVQGHQNRGAWLTPGSPKIVQKSTKGRLEKVIDCLIDF